MEKTYTIYENKFNELQKQIDRLNRRADKLGVPRVRLDWGGTYQETHRVPELDNREMVFILRDVTITGEAPMLEGYRAIAHTEWISIRDGEGNITGGENFIRPFPNGSGEFYSVDSRYREMKPCCEHCNSKKYRRYTFIVEDVETAEQMMVGTTCIDNYTGADSAHKWGRWGEWLKSLDDTFEEASFGMGGGDWDGIELIDFLAQTIAIIEQEGFTSGKMARENMTISTADSVFSEILTPDRHKQWTPIPYNSGHRAEAETIINWIKDWDYVGDDFRATVRLIARHGFVDRSKGGYAAYMPIMWKKHNQAMAEIAERDSQHIGEAGERLELEATVTDIRAFSNHYGFRSLIKFEDNEGNLLVWWCTSESSFDKLNEGDVVDLRGTVKEHSEFRNENQTVLKLCKFTHTYKTLNYEWFAWARDKQQGIEWCHPYEGLGI